MTPSTRLSHVFVALLFAFTFIASSYAQQADDNAVAHAAITSGTPVLGATRTPIKAASVQDGSPSSLMFNVASGAVFGGFQKGLNTAASSLLTSNDSLNFNSPNPNGSTIDGLITVATFSGAFVAQAGPSASRDFRFTMLGNDPKLGGTTAFPTNIDEVSLQLLNADGSVFKVVPFAPFEQLTLESPNFQSLDYRSGHNVEYGDAVHRAQFFNVMKNNWHTQLVPRIVNSVTITVPFFVNIQLQDGSVVQARSYFTGIAGDGSTFVLMLSPLFNFLFDNEVVNEINLGNFTTSGMNLTMFPNTFLFDLNTSNPNAPGSCCVLGFHTYFLDDGFPESRWITQYASWISPGLFGAGFQDVTALSHELAESFGNPFVSNSTPSWQFPGEPPTAKVCQGNLEEGDPIEVLPNATAAIEVKQGKKFDFIYHPQNIPLVQWFEMGTTSSAIDGAFSFPDETVLTQSALPCPQ